MGEIAQPHDRLIRHVLEQPGAAEALLRERLAPELAARLARKSATVEGAFVDEKLGATHGDRLFRARLRDRKSWLYCLIEHKSSPDPLVAIQLLGYLANIWKRLARERRRSEKLPPVVALVVYHGRQTWRPPHRFRGTECSTSRSAWPIWAESRMTPCRAIRLCEQA